MANAATSIVYVIVADPSVRQSIESVIRAGGWRPETFGSAFEFLSRTHPAVPSCLILDVKLPDINGLALQERIAAERRDISVMFLSGFCDVATTVKAMKAGALDFLMKPVDPDVLLNAIRNAIRQSEITLGRESQIHMLRAGYSSLTTREREVMSLVVSGLLNKQVGGELGISEITVKSHRGNVMRKMRANSFADLVNMATRLRLGRPMVMNAASGYGAKPNQTESVGRSYQGIGQYLRLMESHV
jgi:FixJ family two-component response regulator